MSAVLKVGTIYSRLVTDNAWIKKQIHDSLRFREKGYFHNPLYRQRKWDGYTNFFTLNTGQFLTGLLPEIKVALKYLNFDYEIVDTRKPTEFLINKIDESFLWCRNHPRPVVMRDYQIELVNQAIKYKRGLIVSPTGSGKTLPLVSLVKALPPKTNTLILVDSKELVHQNYNELVHFGIEDVGMFYGDVKEPNYVTVCLINSAPHLTKWFPEVKALFVDEVHDQGSKRCIDVYKQLKNCDIRIGISATPFKFGGKDKCQMYKLKGYFGGVLKIKSVDEGKLTTKVLQSQNLLAKANCTFFRIDSPDRQYDLYQDAVTYGIAQNQYLNNFVVKLVQMLKGRSLLIVERIEHGDLLQSLIPNSFWLHGTAKKDVRKKTIEELKTNQGDFVAIAIDKIVNKGINVFIHNLINVAGGKADHQVIQRMGRGLRMSSDKQMLNYYDFFFTINPYLEKHSEQRIKILEKEGHKIDIKDIF